MNKIKLAVKSLVAGVAITLVTGLIRNTPGGLVGASWYGYPTVWIRKLVLAPQYNPWKVDFVGLVADIVFWFVVVLIIALIVCYLKKGGKKSKPATKARSKK